MNWEDIFSSTLRQEFQKIREKNPRFSTRAFARKLGLSSGATSQILSGKKDWKMSQRRALEILDKVELNAREHNRILILMGEEPRKKELNDEGHELLTDWVFPAVLLSFDLAQPPTLEQIAERLGVSETRVRKTVARLLEKGLLTDEDGRLTRNPEFMALGDGPPDEAVRKYHQNNLKLGLRAMETATYEEADFTSLSFAGSRAQMALFKKEIRKLHQKISLLSGREENDEVFTMTVALFPMRFGGDLQ